MSGRGVDRVLDMLEWFGAGRDVSHLSEVAAAMRMPKSSALLMLQVLVDRGYLERQNDGCYALLHLPGAFSPHSNNYGAFGALAAPFLDAAVRQSGETGILAVVDGQHVQFLRKRLPHQEILYDPAIEVSYQLHEDATGISVLAALGHGAVSAYVNAARLTAPDARALELSVREALDEGYVLQNSREPDGLACVAVPVINPSNRPFAAVKLAGPTGRLVANLDHVVEAARTAAADIAKAVARRGAAAS